MVEKIVGGDSANSGGNGNGIGAVVNTASKDVGNVIEGGRTEGNTYNLISQGKVGFLYYPDDLYDFLSTQDIRSLSLRFQELLGVTPVYLSNRYLIIDVTDGLEALIQIDREIIRLTRDEFSIAAIPQLSPNKIVCGHYLPESLAERSSTGIAFGSVTYKTMGKAMIDALNPYYSTDKEKPVLFN